MRKEHSGIRRFLPLSVLLVATIGLQFVTFHSAEAEEPTSQDTLPDRFMVRGGWAYVFSADTTLGINGTSGIGGTVELGRALKAQREDNSWRIESRYRFNPKHSIGFSYYDVSRKGFAGITESIAIGDTTYGAGSQLRSELDMGLYRFFYNYSFYRNDKVELAGSVGMYIADIRVGFAGNFSCTGTSSCTGTPQTVISENQRLFAPLPTFGFLVNYNFTPRLLGQARFDWFYFEVSQFKGFMNEMYLGMEYRLFTHVAVGAAYNRLDVDINYEPEKSTGWNIRNDWNMLYVFGTLYF